MTSYSRSRSLQSEAAASPPTISSPRGQSRGIRSASLGRDVAGRRDRPEQKLLVAGPAATRGDAARSALTPPETNTSAKPCGIRSVAPKNQISPVCRSSAQRSGNPPDRLAEEERHAEALVGG